MCVLAPDANVLSHLERIGGDLLKADAKSERLWTDGSGGSKNLTRMFEVQAEALALAGHRLNGAYDVGTATVELLRALETACRLTDTLPIEETMAASRHLMAARYALQRGLRAVSHS